MVWIVLPNPEQYGGGQVITTAGGQHMDLQIWESGPHWQSDLHVNEKLSPNLFTLDALRRAGR
jgi:hypothetical protein